jgi:hypothetical protein
MPLDPCGTAFHEAGHAVAALALDQSVASLSILGGGNGGEFRGKEPSPAVKELLADAAHPERLFQALADILRPGDGEWAFPNIVMLLSGRVAQRLAGFGDEGCLDDLEKVRVTAEAVSNSKEDAAALLSAAERMAERIIGDRWGAVQRVAALLVVKMRLDAAEIAAIVAAGPGAARRLCWEAAAARAQNFEMLAPRRA